MSYEHRLVEAANGREFYDKIGRDADAEIAALREDLARKEAALQEVLVGDSNISAWGRRIIDAALQPKEPPCKA